MKGNILPTFQTFSVSERVQVEKLKQWDVKVEPSNSVAALLGVTEPVIIPENFESINRMPLKPPNERYIKPNFALTNGPSPLSHAHRGVADKSNLNAPRERRKIEKTVTPKNDPQQYFKIENGSSGELDIYVQTPFAVRNSELGPHCVWTRDIAGSSSAKLNGTATKTLQLPSSDDYFRMYTSPSKDLIVSMTGKQAVKDYVFGPGPIGMQVELSEVDEQKELCCTNVVEGSQAAPFSEELCGAVVLAVNGQRVLSLVEFQTAVTVAKEVVGQVVIKALSFRDSAARAALQQKWNLKKNKNIKSLFTGTLGMFGGAGGNAGGGEVDEETSDEEENSDSDEEEGGEGEADPNAEAAPVAPVEEEDSDEENDILYRRHRRFRAQQALERQHEAALGITHRDPDEEARLAKVRVKEIASLEERDPDEVYQHELATPSFKKHVVVEDPDADLLFSPAMPSIRELDEDTGGHTLRWADETPAEKLEDNEDEAAALSEDEDGALVAKSKPRKRMSHDGDSTIQVAVDLVLPDEEEEEKLPAEEPPVEEKAGDSEPDSTFLTGTNITEEFTDLSQYRTLVCVPELFGAHSSTWGNPQRYCQFQNFSAFCKVSVYWVDEDDTLVLRKVLYPFDEPHLDMVGGEHTWVLTTTRLKSSRLAELKEKLRRPPPSAALKNATGAALIQENEEENEEPDQDDVGLDGLPRSRADGSNCCLVFRPSDSVLNNDAKSLSVIWIPDESITMAQRMRAISTLYKVPQHYSRHNPLHQRRPERRVPPATCADDINRQNPNLSVQIFDPRVAKSTTVPNSVQGKRALAASAAGNRPSSDASSRPGSEPR